MEEIWSRLKRDGEMGLRHLVEEGFQEGVTLEFKQKKDPQTGEFDRDDQKNLGRALSAFSNSLGGLLIWGIVCRNDEVGVDRAQGYSPIKGLSRFASKANDLAGQYLSPKNELVELLPIYSTNEEDTGYLAIKVPRSERRPHRSEAPGDKYYYKRAGTSSFVMEHYDLEDAFKRTAVAVLDLEYSILSNGGGSVGGVPYTSLKIILSLRNSSRSSAIYPYLSLISVRGALLDEYGLDGNGRVGLTPRVTREIALFSGGADSVVHPSQLLDVAALKLKTVDSPIQSRSRPAFPEAYVLEGHQIEFTCEVGCLNAPLERKSFVIKNEEIRKIASS